MTRCAQRAMFNCWPENYGLWFIYSFLHFNLYSLLARDSNREFFSYPFSLHILPFPSHSSIHSPFFPPDTFLRFVYSARIGVDLAIFWLLCPTARRLRTGPSLRAVPNFTVYFAFAIVRNLWIRFSFTLLSHFPIRTFSSRITVKIKRLKYIWTLDILG